MVDQKEVKVPVVVDAYQDTFSRNQADVAVSNIQSNWVVQSDGSILCTLIVAGCDAVQFQVSLQQIAVGMRPFIAGIIKSNKKALTDRGIVKAGTGGRGGMKPVLTVAKVAVQK